MSSVSKGNPWVKLKCKNCGHAVDPQDYLEEETRIKGIPGVIVKAFCDEICRREFYRSLKAQ